MIKCYPSYLTCEWAALVNNGKRDSRCIKRRTSDLVKGTQSASNVTIDGFWMEVPLHGVME